MSWEDIAGWAGFRDTYARYVRDHARNGDVVVEIGVFAGKSIAYLARLCLDKGLDVTIYGVDPWESDNGDDGRVPQGCAAEVRTHGGPFQFFCDSMTRHAREELERVRILRCTSLIARRLFDAHSLAMVCIDGSHRYEDVLDDIRAWSTAVRTGGILCGDDCQPGFPGVVRAVEESFGKDGFTLEGHQRDTWVAR